MKQSHFREEVLVIIRAIPLGTTLTYKQVAECTSSPRAYRAVGAILRMNFDPAVPCHRVIRSDGTLGGYNRGVRRKRELLKRERAI